MRKRVTLVEATPGAHGGARYKIPGNERMVGRCAGKGSGKTHFCAFLEKAGFRGAARRRFTRFATDGFAVLS